MAINTRKKNANWVVCDERGQTLSVEHAQLAALMDLRDELQGIRADVSRLTTLLHCHNFTGIPATLRTISRKLSRRKPRPRKA
jgi:hypothetical protein